VLLFGFVSGVVVVVFTTLTFVPVVATVALIVIATEPPAAMLEIAQSSANAVVVHVPADVVAETNVTEAGAASATLTFWAASGPVFETAMEYVIGAEPPPAGNCTAGVAAFVTVMSTLGLGGVTGGVTGGGVDASVLTVVTSTVSPLVVIVTIPSFAVPELSLNVGVPNE